MRAKKKKKYIHRHTYYRDTLLQIATIAFGFVWQMA